MIPGFNTDIEHGGITYHVQTEDKGVESPIILSLVYHGGAILASKRTPYDDLLATELDEATLAERLQRQHKLICAAIRSGRIEDLKRMNERSMNERSPVPAVAQSSAEIALPLEPMTLVDADASGDILDLGSPLLIGEPIRLEIEEPSTASSTAHVIKDGVADFARRLVADDAPTLSLLEEMEIRGGRELSLQVKLTRGSGDDVMPLGAATIKVKVLGTAFPLISCDAQTDDEGIATVSLSIPAFTTGRAVLLISATANGHEATLRRIVPPA